MESHFGSHSDYTGEQTERQKIGAPLMDVYLSTVFAINHRFTRLDAFSNEITTIEQ